MNFSLLQWKYLKNIEFNSNCYIECMKFSLLQWKYLKNIEFNSNCYIEHELFFIAMKIFEKYWIQLKLLYWIHELFFIAMKIFEKYWIQLKQTAILNIWTFLYCNENIWKILNSTQTNCYIEYMNFSLLQWKYLKNIEFNSNKLLYWIYELFFIAMKIFEKYWIQLKQTAILNIWTFLYCNENIWKILNSTQTNCYIEYMNFSLLQWKYLKNIEFNSNCYIEYMNFSLLQWKYLKNIEFNSNCYIEYMNFSLLQWKYLKNIEFNSNKLLYWIYELFFIAMKIFEKYWIQLKQTAILNIWTFLYCNENIWKILNSTQTNCYIEYMNFSLLQWKYLKNIEFNSNKLLYWIYELFFIAMKIFEKYWIQLKQTAILNIWTFLYCNENIWKILNSTQTAILNTWTFLYCNENIWKILNSTQTAILNTWTFLYCNENIWKILNSTQTNCYIEYMNFSLLQWKYLKNIEFNSNKLLYWIYELFFIAMKIFEKYWIQLKLLYWKMNFSLLQWKYLKNIEFNSNCYIERWTFLYCNENIWKILNLTQTAILKDELFFIAMKIFEKYWIQLKLLYWKMNFSLLQWKYLKNIEFNSNCYIERWTFLYCNENIWKILNLTQTAILKDELFFIAMKIFEKYWIQLKLLYWKMNFSLLQWKYLKNIEFNSNCYIECMNFSLLQWKYLKNIYHLWLI